MELEKFNRDSAADSGLTPQIELKKNSQDKFLAVLYGSVWGRMILKPLVSPLFSLLGGKILDSKPSAWIARPFARKNHIDLSEYKKDSFLSFNDFFTREIKPEARPILQDESIFISPCDSRLSIYSIHEDSSFEIKHSTYTVASLLKNRELAKRYKNGTLWMFRLCVDDYHRYIYPLSAKKSRNIHIDGVFHTVNPVASEHYQVYKENTREYTLLQNPDFGTVIMMEVGALLVGKIINHHLENKVISRGEEKGYFAFGGSTILLLTQEGCVKPDERFRSVIDTGLEQKVRLGEKIGIK